MKEESGKWFEVKGWRKRFRGNLGFWAVHCVISALPGFCIGMQLTQVGRSSAAIAAMLVAIETFAVLLAMISSLCRQSGAKQMLFARGLRLGLVLRGLMCGACLLLLVNEPGDSAMLFCMPDVWAGILAALSMGLAFESMGYGQGLLGILDGNTNAAGAIGIFVIAMVHGMFLCFLIFVLSFVSMLVLEMRDRRLMYSQGDEMVSAFLCKLRAMGPGNAMRVSGSRLRSSVGERSETALE